MNGDFFGNWFSGTVGQTLDPNPRGKRKDLLGPQDLDPKPRGKKRGLGIMAPPRPFGISTPHREDHGRELRGFEP